MHFYYTSLLLIRILFPKFPATESESAIHLSTLCWQAAHYSYSNQVLHHLAELDSRYAVWFPLGLKLAVKQAQTGIGQLIRKKTYSFLPGYCLMGKQEFAGKKEDKKRANHSRHINQ